MTSSTSAPELGRDGVDRVAFLGRVEHAVGGRDVQLLADVELVLGLQPVGPPERVHVEMELGRDADERVTGLDLVDLDLVLDAAGVVLDDDRLDERAVGRVRGAVHLAAAGRSLDDRLATDDRGGLERGFVTRRPDAGIGGATVGGAIVGDGSDLALARRGSVRSDLDGRRDVERLEGRPVHLRAAQLGSVSGPSAKATPPVRAAMRGLSATPLPSVAPMATPECSGNVASSDATRTRMRTRTGAPRRSAARSERCGRRRRPSKRGRRLDGAVDGVASTPWGRAVAAGLAGRPVGPAASRRSVSRVRARRGSRTRRFRVPRTVTVACRNTVS